MIDGYTNLVGLIGWPVAHSLSPAMHNAAFDAFGLNWRYVPLPVPPGQVETAVRGLAALGFRGANVTVPHKQTVMPALSTIGPAARVLGAVNTLVVDFDEEPAGAIAGATVVSKEGPRWTFSFKREEVSANDLIARILAVSRVSDMFLREPDIGDIVRDLYEGKIAL